MHQHLHQHFNAIQFYFTKVFPRNGKHIKSSLEKSTCFLRESIIKLSFQWKISTDKCNEANNTKYYIISAKYNLAKNKILAVFRNIFHVDTVCNLRLLHETFSSILEVFSSDSTWVWKMHLINQRQCIFLRFLIARSF